MINYMYMYVSKKLSKTSQWTLKSPLKASTNDLSFVPSSVFISLHIMTDQAGSGIREFFSFTVAAQFRYEVWSELNRYFQISGVAYVRFSDFFSVMLVHMSFIYEHVDSISHFEVSVCFWQIIRLVVFWCALRFFTIRKSGSKSQTVLSFV